MNGTHLKIILNQQEQQWEEIRKAGRYGSNCSGLEQLGLTRKQSYNFQKSSINTNRYSNSTTMEGLGISHKQVSKGLKLC